MATEGTPRAARTHRVGWTRGTAPSRSTTGPRALRIFLMEEIFSSWNLLIRLKPAGRSGGGETRPRHGCRGLMLSKQGAEPVPGESGLRGPLVCGARGASLTRYVLVLVPDQILVPELRARLPCKANQHITAVSPGYGQALQAGSGSAEPPKPRRVSGCCRELAPAPRHAEVAGSRRAARIQQMRLPRQHRLLANSHQERSSRLGRDGG